MKTYEHIAVKPETFQAFRKLKDRNIYKSDDAFLAKLLEIFRRK